MTTLGLVWTMGCLMTTVSSQIPAESDFVRYPGINDTEVLTYECPTPPVFWFRTLHNNLDFQFFLSLNNAGQASHEASVDEHRFKARKSEDTGLYTCMLQNQKENELWMPGVLLRPGGERNPFPCMALTIPNVCCTKSNYQTPKGCGSKVLWPLVGVLLALAVALISTLYYFSRECLLSFLTFR
uniref:Ig-like domain-containing protein n=1 Tax=Hucho hucho TaxID=62062 RepID=A0A4W5NVZ3_9TELE